MIHEKIIRRDDGSRVKIRVRLICDYAQDDPQWSFTCSRCEPGKRTWTTSDKDDYSLRRLSRDEIQAEFRRRALTLASEEEIAEAMRELIAKIVPVV